MQTEGDCDMAKLNAWLSKLLQEKGGDLFRSKGILSVAGSNEKCVYSSIIQKMRLFAGMEEPY